MAQPADASAPNPEPKSVTPAEIGRDWGTSRSYASQCVKKGCPTASLEAARQWRNEHARYGVGYRSKGTPSVRAESPPPVVQPAAEKPSPPREPSVWDFDSMEGSLAAAIDVEREAHRLVEEAQREKTDSLIAVRIQSYNKARDGRMEAEKRVQEWKEKQEKLISMDRAHSVARRALVPILTLLRAMPKRAAIKANPADDLHAEKVLSEEVEEIIAEVRLAFAG